MKNVPWRMILILALLILVALFSGFNLNPVDISIGFHVFTDVPLFLALIASFIVGAVVVVPFTILKRSAKKLPAGDESNQINKPKKTRKRRAKEEEAVPPSSQETVSEE